MRRMDLKTYIGKLPADDREAFAVRCGTTPGHMRNVMYRQKSCAPDLAVGIERESGREVTRRDLRPDDWHRIWPELVTNEFPAPAQAEPAQQGVAS